MTTWTVNVSGTFEKEILGIEAKTEDEAEAKARTEIEANCWDYDSFTINIDDIEKEEE